MFLWEPLEYVGETLVFIGVVGEVYAEWPEPERRNLAKASSIVLIIGLALSLAALIGTNEHFNGTIADLNLKASQANERAAGAEGKLAGLEKQASDAKAGQQKVEIELNEQKARAATAEADLIRLQERLSWRTIGAAQRKKLVAALKVGPKGPITIAYPGEDQEAFHFAGLLHDVLKDAGWSDARLQPFFADNNTGLGVLAHKPDDTQAYGDFLQRAFVSQGIPCWKAYNDTVSSGVVLSVGHRNTGP
jgi:hypothetical protein